MIDERWIRSLHVQSMRHADLHAERKEHALFQASTIGALLDGSYDGDLRIAELAERGNLGVGTLNALDGELIVLGGSFLRADIEGVLHPVGPDERTPFAVVTRFEPSVGFGLDGPLTHDELLAAVDVRLPDGSPSCAVRVDGEFRGVRARSVPRQTPPYRPLAEVVADQREFELGRVEGTMVGFRFPDYAEGIEVGGYHLHFATADRTRGGHVLDSRAGPVRVQLDPSYDLHVELPPGVDLTDPGVAASTHEAIELVERGR
jgi:acetolactate decarboxylase